MNTDHFDRNMIHVFLREEVARQTPPDMSREILARALGRSPVDRPAERPAGAALRKRWEIPVAVAATILIAFIVWTAMLPTYPAPSASGDYSLAAGDSVQRGATIRTEDETAVLELGGYCRVDIRPWTTLRIDGRRRAEEIFLETGTVVCRVDSNVGRFTVSTEVGTVSVRGTEFTVRIARVDGLKSMWVKVDSGFVQAGDRWGTEVLSDGQEWTATESEAQRPETAPGNHPTDKPNQGSQRGPATDKDGTNYRDFGFEADGEAD